jgi:hypothetical protein
MGEAGRQTLEKLSLLYYHDCLLQPPQKYRKGTAGPLPEVGMICTLANADVTGCREYYCKLVDGNRACCTAAMRCRVSQQADASLAVPNFKQSAAAWCLPQIAVT